MTMSSETLYSLGFDVLEAVIDADTEREAAEAARRIVSDLGGDDLRWLATMLAVELVWNMRPRRARDAVGPERQALRRRLEQRRIGLLQRMLERGPTT